MGWTRPFAKEPSSHLCGSSSNGRAHYDEESSLDWMKTSNLSQKEMVSINILINKYIN